MIGEKQLIQTGIVKLFLYSYIQKTMEQKDDIIAILKRFDVVTKQIFLLVTQQSMI